MEPLHHRHRGAAGLAHPQLEVTRAAVGAVAGQAGRGQHADGELQVEAGRARRGQGRLGGGEVDVDGQLARVGRGSRALLEPAVRHEGVADATADGPAALSRAIVGSERPTRERGVHSRRALSQGRPGHADDGRDQGERDEVRAQTGCSMLEAMAATFQAVHG